MLATAIDLATTLELEASEELYLESENFDGVVRFDPRSVSGSLPPSGMPDWGRYAWAAFAILRDRLPASPLGFRGRLIGRLPGAGLSSSASVLLAYLNGWAAVNGLVLDPKEQVTLAVAAENRHAGVACGVLDPAAIVGSRRGAMLSIDSAPLDWDPVELGASAPNAGFLVFFSGRARNLVATGFNRRVAECLDAAVYVAQKTDSPNVGRLGDLDRAVLREFLDEIPGLMGRRARHFVEENDRVEKGRTAWAMGRLDIFGDLMNDSCRSSIENFEAGSEELIALQNIWQSTEGVLGARFSGGGFGGCSLALVDHARAAEVSESVLERFSIAFPELAGTASVIAVEGADGLALR